MHIYLGYDHNGFEVRNQLIAHIEKLGHTVTDLGNKEHSPADDYPDFAELVAKEMLTHPSSKGILLCGSGIGICIAANKFKGIRAALAVTKDQAISARNDDDANILCLGAKINTLPEMLELVDIFLSTTFAGGRHERRKNKVLAFEEANFK